jgi:hypothetical protein
MKLVCYMRHQINHKTFFESVASDLGANSLEIYGFGIINSKLFNPSIATRLGYKCETLDSGRVIRLSKNLFGGE